MIASTVRLMAKSFATKTNGLLFRNATVKKANELLFRNAAVKDIDIITRRIINEGWHVGPYDFHCAFAFCPKGVFMADIDGELVSHVTAIDYPNLHSHIGGLVVTEKYRNEGYGLNNSLKAIEACNQSYTIGGDVNLDLKSNYEALGFERIWDTYVATLDIDKIIGNLAKATPPGDFTTKPIHKVSFEKLFEYDRFVFGTARRKFLEKWVTVPGSFGWAAVNEKNDIVGYIVLKQVFREAGREIGMTIAPLFCNDVQIAKLLLLTAAENCHANPAVPKTKLELLLPVGEKCGEDASQLMKDLEAELTHIACRMYTKGIPPDRQLKQIYGIASPTFD